MYILQLIIFEIVFLCIYTCMYMRLGLLYFHTQTWKENKELSKLTLINKVTSASCLHGQNYSLSGTHVHNQFRFRLLFLTSWLSFICLSSFPFILLPWNFSNLLKFNIPLLSSNTSEQLNMAQEHKCPSLVCQPWTRAHRSAPPQESLIQWGHQLKASTCCT